ncbi:MAG: indolepyruvate ferredoxin oxidoreductase subunit alpha [Selenomonadaceae bacterium]|nr:indolepyruvate ferredoxin oxidoreductase subunit alpha [Selenomonadaceae bacterium]
MHKEYLMGNEAMGLGAMAAGVNLVSGYPGTPSTEVLETIARHNVDKRIHVEWSTNEKTGLETAAGAAMTGARALVTMKQVGLNVATDPLMSLAYLGVEGGLVVLVADDPGPISSQTEQDTRTFARYAKLPCFDPTGVAEAYEMIQEAFAFSERYHTPVLFRPTTRVDHGYASVTVKDKDEWEPHASKGFVRDTKRWVIFPKLSFRAHGAIEARNANLTKVLSEYPRNEVLRGGETVSRGVVSHGVSWTYLRESIREFETAGHADTPRLMRVATPFPFPEEKAAAFLEGLDEVLVIEELDPVIERELTYLCGKYHLAVRIRGKLTGDIAAAGENTRDSVYAAVAAFMGWQTEKPAEHPMPPTEVVRPPVLCAGCPHRASFYAVKQAMKGQKCLFAGDIGCYTLGNAMPLDMVDTCLCMGAGLGMAQGVGAMDPETKCFAFVGDSTFFAAAIPGAVNGVYNQADMTLVVLDNSTTAMTGHQPHPGTGHTMMGESVTPVSIEDTLHGIGVHTVRTVNPLDLPRAIETVRETAAQPGVKAIVFRWPCIALVKPLGLANIDPEKCRDCKRCIREIGCPGLVTEKGKVVIDAAQCTGCGLCGAVCPFDAITVTKAPHGGEPKGGHRSCR